MSIYKDRMLGYYPPVVSAIKDIRAIVDSEYPEFENIDEDMFSILDDCWLVEGKVSGERIAMWETALGIGPVSGSTLSDRRDTIVARLRGGSKLNTESINAIVSAFTGGTAKSYFEDSTIYIGIQPPPGNKTYIFSNVEQEIARLKPAHLGLSVYRNYRTWTEVSAQYTTWEDVLAAGTWLDVMYPDSVG